MWILPMLILLWVALILFAFRKPKNNKPTRMVAEVGEPRERT